MSIEMVIAHILDTIDTEILNRKMIESILMKLQISKMYLKKKKKNIEKVVLIFLQKLDDICK